MTERKRPSKVYHVTINEEHQAMALIQKASDICCPFNFEKALLWAVWRYMPNYRVVHKDMVKTND